MPMLVNKEIPLFDNHVHIDDTYQRGYVHAVIYKHEFSVCLQCTYTQPQTYTDRLQDVLNYFANCRLNAARLLTFFWIWNCNQFVFSWIQQPQSFPQSCQFQKAWCIVLYPSACNRVNSFPFYLSAEESNKKVGAQMTLKENQITLKENIAFSCRISQNEKWPQG